LGLLEALWNVTAEQTPDGAIGTMTDDDIAMEMFYDGDAGKMIEAMVTAELLDRDVRVRLIVHDWHLHSDDTTDVKLARARRRYAGGEIPRMRKLSKDEREKILADFREMPNSVRTTAHNGALPEPEPEPEPDTNTPQPPAQAQGACGVESTSDAHARSVIPISEAKSAREDSQGDDGGLRRRGAPPGVEPAVWRAAVDSVLLACDSGDRKLKRAVERSLNVATAKARERGQSEWPDEIAGRMVSSWKEFTWNIHRMKYPLGPVNFFSQGVWANQSRWPWNPEELRHSQRASVGA
jgi:hypothetical protein